MQTPSWEDHGLACSRSKEWTVRCSRVEGQRASRPAAGGCTGGEEVTGVGAVPSRLSGSSYWEDKQGRLHRGGAEEGDSETLDEVGFSAMERGEDNRPETPAVSTAASEVKGHWLSTGSRHGSREHSSDFCWRRYWMSRSMDLSSVFSSVISADRAISRAVEVTAPYHGSQVNFPRSDRLPQP